MHVEPPVHCCEWIHSPPGFSLSKQRPSRDIWLSGHTQTVTFLLIKKFPSTFRFCRGHCAADVFSEEDSLAFEAESTTAGAHLALLRLAVQIDKRHLIIRATYSVFIRINNEIIVLNY
jgi:hypothetical protein